MYARTRSLRALAAVPALVLIIGISVIGATADAATDTTQLVNFGLGTVVGFVLVLIGGLLTLGRGSPQDR